MCWADVPELSARDRPCPVAWQQYWQQTAGAAPQEPNRNRISSSIVGVQIGSTWTNVLDRSRLNAVV
jgi:hypothetical protein